jgi:hypothetical protein
MNKLATLTLISLLLVPLAALRAAEPTTTQQIDQKTLDEWSAPYRGWHYYPDPVIPSDWKIPANEKFHSYDVPTVYQLSATASSGRSTDVTPSRSLLKLQMPVN